MEVRDHDETRAWLSVSKSELSKIYGVIEPDIGHLTRILPVPHLMAFAYILGAYHAVELGRP